MDKKMKKLTIDTQNHLQILTDDEFYLTGINEKLYISVGENVNAKIFITNAHIDILECKILKNSSLNLEFISLVEKNNISTFDLEENSFLNLKIVTTKNINEETSINLNGKNSRFQGQYLVIEKDDKNQIITRVSHKEEKTISDISNLGISLGNGKVRFETIGKIEKGCKKSSCQQLTRGIILSDNSEIISQPILLIDEFDSQANHGVAIGKITQDELFYMMSRGISQKDAEQLIMASFIEPFLENLLDENLRREISNSIYSLL